MTTTYSAYIRSSGQYVPETIIKNDDLPEELETSDEWIRPRSGIHERRYVKPGWKNSDLALKAVQNLLTKGEIDEQEIDCLIFCTLSPDMFFPGTGVFLQDKLGWAERCIPCFDIRQQCAGFIYGLQMAKAFVESGTYKNVLLVGSELHSNLLDYSVRGRSVTVLFGDGAAAVVVSRSADPQSGILYIENHSDGRGAMNGLHMKVFDVGKKPAVDYDPYDFNANADLFPQMPSSKNLFSNAVRRMTQVSLSALNHLELSTGDIDWVLPHQANKRINTAVAQKLEIPDAKVLYNIHKYGNTSAATIPLLLSEFTTDGTIQRGDLLLLVAFGSGFTWGAAVMRY
jgi:3-oxoacyl-[acyl-carrier-protein] synthase-3